MTEPHPPIRDEPADRAGRLVIVGGGPAGLSVARSYRENGGDGQVLIISDDEALPYQRPPLSKEYLRGDIAERQVGAEIGLIETAELASMGVDVRLNSRVTDVDPDRHRVRCADGAVLDFAGCVLAPGCGPASLPVPGGDDPRVHVLRSLADARRLRQAAENARTAVVIGSGFIGCEAAASLARRGLRVTLVSNERAPQRDRLGPFAAGRITAWLTEVGVDLVMDAEVRSIDAGSPAVDVDGRRLEADLLVVAAGARPRVELARGAGLEMVDGRIVVDERMRTSAPGVLAAGDAVYAFNPTAGRHLKVEHWGEALAMGEVAGATAAGADGGWDGVPGFWSQIGDRQLKYAAWGDGFDDEQVREHPDGGFTVWYGLQGTTVGVLTYLCDRDYDAGRRLVGRAAPLTESSRPPVGTDPGR